VEKDEVLLTGITSIGRLRAYFMTKAPQGKNPEYYSLGPDEKKDGMEIVEIDPMSKSVRVRNSGIETVMTFGVKPPATPAPVPNAPGIVGAPTVAPLPATASFTPPPLTPGPSISPNNRLRTIPSRNLRTPPNMGLPEVAPNQPQAQPNPYAAEQDVLLMELQRKSNPNVTFPPTPMPQ
jgi:hypothetical protein